MGTFDFIIIGVAVLFLVIGLLMGMRKLLFGIVASIVAIVLAAVVTQPFGNAVIEGTDWDDKLVTTFAQSYSEQMPNGNYKLVYADSDSDPATADELGFYDADSNWYPLEEALEGNTLAKVGFSNFLKNYYTPEESVQNPKTAVILFSEMLTRIIFLAGAFVILWILFGVAFWLIGKLVKTFVTATYAGKIVDKVLGAAISVGVMLVLLMLVFTVFDILSALPPTASAMETVKEMVDSSTLGSLIAQNNFISKLIGVEKIVASIGGGA